MESQEQNGADEVEGRGCQSLRSAQACVCPLFRSSQRSYSYPQPHALLYSTILISCFFLTLKIEPF